MKSRTAQSVQSSIIGVTMWALNIIIFVLVYGRMIEIYLLTSLSPIPVATLANRELGHTGQNYLRSLFAVGFQGMLILVCVAIYAVLVQGIATGGDPIGAIWGAVGPQRRCCYRVRQQRLLRRRYDRSEERRVGKECRSRWSPYH